MTIPQGVDEVPRPSVGHVGQHDGQQGVTGELQCGYANTTKQSPPSNVEGDPQPHVSTSLVQLAGQLAVCHVELGVVRNQKVMFGLIPGLDSDREARPSCPGPRGSRHTA